MGTSLGSVASAVVPIESVPTIIEAESMALKGGYTVEANAAASGGQLIRRLDSGGYPATASTEHTGAAGNYDITVSYFDENDGMSDLAFLLNGQVLDEWVADEDPVCSDCASPGASTLRTRVVARGARLLPGDEITLQGTGEHYEYARFDKLAVSPAGSSTYEAEKMALKGGYAVEDNAAASGGQLIRRLASGGYAATASTDFAGLAGTYKITVSYFDESDGVSSLAFLVNGEMQDQWLAEEDPVCSDCDSPGASTLRTRVVASKLGLQPGDEIALQGTGEHYEYARFDKLTVSPTVVDPVLFNDGGDHLINFDISTGIRVENGTSVTIAPGVIISSATLYGSNLTNNGGELSSVSLHEGSLMTVNGGTIGGVGADTGSGVILNDGVIGGAELAWEACGGFKMFAGSIGSLSVMGPCTGVTIVGGSVGALNAYDADIGISGGEFGRIEVCCDTGLGISGGHFSERLLVSSHSFGNISGGTFASTVDLDLGVDAITFAFLGKLTLGEIVKNEAEYPFVFSRQVGGTFADGTPADLRFRCSDMYACEHVYVAQTTN
jgi:hypothetical protein